MSARLSEPVRYALGGMIAMTTAMGVGRFVYTPILPGMMEGLSLSASDAGLIASANYVGYLAGAMLAAGGWAERRERPIMLGALAVSALLLFAMPLAGSLWQFMAIRFIAGIAAAFLMVFLAAIVFSHLATAGRNDLQAVHFAGVGLGIAISGAMIGALTLLGGGWQAGWTLAGLLALLSLLPVMRLVPDGPVAAAGAVREPPLPGTRPMRAMILAYGLFGLGYIVTATFLVAIVRQNDGGRLFESTVWLVTGLAGIPSVWLWSWCVRRIGLVETFAVGCLVEAIGVAASVTLGGSVGPLLGGALLGGTFIAVTAFGLQVGRALAGPSPRRALALMTAAFGLGQVIGPIAAGFVADATGSFFAPSAGASLALVAAAAIALISVRKRDGGQTRERP